MGDVSEAQEARRPETGIYFIQSQTGRVRTEARLFYDRQLFQNTTMLIIKPSQLRICRCAISDRNLGPINEPFKESSLMI